MSPSVEPFDEAKYEYLMDGLECNVVLLSRVKQYVAFRIDSHFFEKKYRELGNVLSMKTCLPLKELVLKSIQTGHTPSMSVDSYYGGRIALIKTDNLHDNKIGTVFNNYLTEKGNAVIARTSLASGDIITTIIGATEKIIARSAIVSEECLPANINQNIVQIRINPQKVAPEYVNTFLNTKYGKGYLIYLSRQTEQFNLNCKEIEKVPIPILSCDFQQVIVNIVQAAQKSQKKAHSMFKSAEVELTDWLNVQTAFQQPISTEKWISESFFKTGRLDAEYYQQKYEIIANDLHTDQTVLSLCNLHDKTFTPNKNIGYKYIELANVGRNGELSGVDYVFGDELPSRARRKVSAGQVIISSVEGSLQSCALIGNEYDGALCSTGFFVLDSDFINPETLLVLFKSEPIQALLKQRCSGTILTAISKNELQSMPLPLIDIEVQKSIATQVAQSSTFRSESEELHEFAKRAVEIAIEQGENAALEWLKQRVSSK